MAGFDLKEGWYEERDITEDELWASLACIFTVKSRNDASYKYGFLKSILDNLNNVDQNLKLTFDQLFTTFTEVYWGLILEHKLHQKASASDNRKAVIERVLQGVSNIYGEGEYIPFEKLPMSVRHDVVHHVKMKCKIYVVGALFEDTKRLFYSFSKKEEWIQINPQMYKFVCKRKKDIEKLNNYEWAYFLAGVNKGYTANDILTRCLLNKEPACINTTEMFFESETTERNQRVTQGQKDILLSESDGKNTFDEIDDETKALLDDPVALIKHLKKRRRI